MNDDTLEKHNLYLTKQLVSILLKIKYDNMGLHCSKFNINHHIISYHSALIIAAHSPYQARAKHSSIFQIPPLLTKCNPARLPVWSDGPISQMIFNLHKIWWKGWILLWFTIHGMKWLWRKTSIYHNNKCNVQISVALWWSEILS